MNVEPSEWRFFGDAPPPAVAGTPQQVPTARPVVGTSTTFQRAWLVLGGIVVIAIVAAAAFLATLALSAGPRDNVVVAARAALGSPSIHADASVPGAAPLTAGALLVDVEGAVRSPGLRRVPAGSRLGDAIAAAGGYADRADLVAAASALNLAEPLADGAKVRVPLLGERATPILDRGPGTSSAPAMGTASGLIDLNRADQAALESLPGIGTVTAAKIIAARETAPFVSLDDVVSRKAVSASVMDKVRELVTVRP